MELSSVTTFSSPRASSSGRTSARPKRMSCRFDQQDRVLADGRAFNHAFENRSQIANRDLFTQQLLENFLHFSQGHQLGDQFLDQLGMRVGQAVDQAFGLAAGKQLVGILADHLAEMGSERGNVVDHRVPGRQGLRLGVARNPLGGNIEGGLAGFLTRAMPRRKVLS